MWNTQLSFFFYAHLSLIKQLVMSMSFRHFFKQFPYTLSRYLTHPPCQYAAPLSLLSTISFRNYEPTNHPTPSSLFTKKFSISSSVYTVLDTPSSPAYLSVRIRCQKHLIVSLFFFIITGITRHVIAKGKEKKNPHCCFGL